MKGPLGLLCVLLLFISCKESSKKVSQDFAYTNTLVHETSPYLLQHAHNPVNWQPWTDTIYNAAKKENKLVVLSIGYSTCHWCHKMEEETFTDISTAEFMNANFINVKVDREERPDVDKVYMTAVQLMNGSGGWPLNVITLPNGKPIYGGTYHSKEEWNAVLKRFNELYKNDSLKLNAYADKVALGIEEVNLAPSSKKLNAISKDSLIKATTTWKLKWDTQYGGTIADQKFVLPTSLIYLMNYGVIESDLEANNFAKKTLDSIASSGIVDHIDGGFYRYSTVPDWSIPHFEKMLYDNAQIMALYAEAYKRYKTPRYKEIVYAIDAFLTEHMLHDGGGYYAALDADTDGEEGKYYTWSKDELHTLLGTEYDLFAAYYKLNPKNTLENGTYVLQHTASDATFCISNRISSDKLQQLKNDWKKALKKARNKRTYPSKDDKIITSWNSLLINGYVEAYKTFNDDSFLKKAKAINSFILENCYKNNALIHSYKKGGKRTAGFLEDYATLTNANINLYSATLNPEYLNIATSLNETTHQKFYDVESGFYRFKEEDNLISKIIPTHDGVLDSPNATVAENLFLLGHILYHDAYSAQAKKMIQTMAPLLQENLEGYTKWSSLALHLSSTYYEIAVVGSNATRLTQELNSSFLANTLIIGTETTSTIAIYKDRFEEDKNYIYVCLNNSCKLPVTSVPEALQQIEYNLEKGNLNFGF
ncbi:thioredoxin domain-containing protein [Cellulophaga sp. E16_2]|uniref:thioredoxin domain-containing protein n=1 Tax=Cellulophaga sp. E16_2 TaxID=2789297 RepID=UPI001A90E8F9|nr:thioredoxin domain-containing protein [Cellulophaga sp. E16_2]MBO0590617.1 thioredoxin domain-containing protein [Cellulophaga sp. E16_2]